MPVLARHAEPQVRGRRELAGKIRDVLLVHGEDSTVPRCSGCADDTCIQGHPCGYPMTRTHGRQHRMILFGAVCGRSMAVFGVRHAHHSHAQDASTALHLTGLMLLCCSPFCLWALSGPCRHGPMGSKRTFPLDHGAQVVSLVLGVILRGQRLPGSAWQAPNRFPRIPKLDEDYAGPPISSSSSSSFWVSALGSTFSLGCLVDLVVADAAVDLARIRPREIAGETESVGRTERPPALTRPLRAAVRVPSMVRLMARADRVGRLRSIQGYLSEALIDRHGESGIPG
jgi:hypothetical protein